MTQPIQAACFNSVPRAHWAAEPRKYLHRGAIALATRHAQCADQLSEIRCGAIFQ